MRRLTILMTVCATFMLLAGSAAAAPRQHAGDGHHVASLAGMGGAHPVATDILGGTERFAPLGARLAGVATVYGTLYNSYGSPTAGARVEWSSLVGSNWVGGEGTTAGDGWFAVNVAPTANGNLWAHPNDDSVFAPGGDTWSNGGSYDRTLYPGRVSVTGYRGGPWGDFDKLIVRLWGATRFSMGAVNAFEANLDPVSDDIDVLDGSYTAGSAEFFYDEGVEFYGSIGVISGATSPATVSVSEANAQRVVMTAPYWRSGKPGATVTITRNNFPAGWSNKVTGHTDDPMETASKEYGMRPSSGIAEESLSLKIPSTATPGYVYWLGLQHVDGAGNYYPLYLQTPYQVCTLKATRTSIRKGRRIRVTGVVPIQGHWGDEPGIKKVVTLYAHKGKAAVPTDWDPKRRGWVKVGAVKTTTSGAYKMPYFKPRKTVTLVARYEEDDVYWGAYTSTQKITVRPVR